MTYICMYMYVFCMYLHVVFQCGDTLLQFCTDLCVFAINVDKGQLEKLKGSSFKSHEYDEEILARKGDMFKVSRLLLIEY